MRAEMAALKQEREQARFQDTRQKEEQQVISLAVANEEHVPYAARLASTQPAKFNSLVHAMARHLRNSGEQVTYEGIVQAVEAELSGYAEVYRPKQTVGEATPSAVPVSAQVSKARSLSSRTTAGRSTLASPDDKIVPLNERADDLVQRIRRGDTL